MSRKTALKLAALFLLTAGLAACASLSWPWKKDAEPAAVCYWMTQDGSRWVAQPDVTVKAQCQDLDSCSKGGGGASGGGCYKWSRGPNAPGAAWDQ